MTVSQLNDYIKMCFDANRYLQNVSFRGEIAEYKVFSGSGHAYFTVKDDGSKMSCVMFAANLKRLLFYPEPGMSVIVTGYISVYTKEGRYQFYAANIVPDGEGAQAVALRQLKERLARQGVFDENRKTLPPAFPKKIGVVTSATGAVIQDIKNVVTRRCPLTEIVLYPATVQGERAPEQIAAGIREFNRLNNVDVIIVGRGGGGKEDLSAFNDEGVIWAVYDSKIPIISAVGHEIDYTLCDLAADLRAPTPSAAAELAVPDKEVLIREMSQQLSRMQRRVSDIINADYQDIDRLCDKAVLKHPERLISNEMEFLSQFMNRASLAVQNRIMIEEKSMEAVTSIIKAYSPMELLSKGYAYASKDGKCVSSVKSVNKGDNISVRLSDGTIECSVSEIK